MLQVPLPKYHELLWPTLCALKELGGSGTINEIVDKIVELEGFTEEQQSVPHGDGPTSEIAYRSAWARTYLKKVGAVDNNARGVWSITDEGRRLTRSDMAGIPRQVQAMLARTRPAGVTARTGEVIEKDEELEDAWREKLLEMILAAPADAFERLVQRLLREADFVSVKVTGRSGDQGIDGIGVYRLSLVGFPVFFQCKRYRGSVGPGAVRDFRGAMTGRGDKGFLITTGTFTAEAKAEANRAGAPPIDLIDGYQLCDLLKKYQLGVRTTERVVEEVDIDENFLSSL
ncbi:MAG: restriction endonuclease [Egibacteraceae bacterium]